MLRTIRDFIVGDLVAISSAARLLKNECLNLFFKHNKGPKVLRYAILSIMGMVLIHFSHHYTNSICVITLAYILLFDLFSIIV